MNAAIEKYKMVSCPCKNCDTFFSGAALQIANNFKKHYYGKHIKKNDLCVIDEVKKEKMVSLIGELYDYILGSFEPETSVEDAALIAEEASKDENKGYNLKNYISNNAPVCREERQYALYFANKLETIKSASSLNEEWAKPLLEKSSNGVSILRPGDSVEEVFYEVTIMRDYWDLNKRHFNSCLYKYVKDNNSLFSDFCSEEALPDKKLQDGSNSELHANSWHPDFYIAKWMMNAKPDIGLIIENNGVYRLTFLECKYTSGEDVYKHYKIKGSMKQTDLQEHILKFICNKLQATYGSKPLTTGDIGLVRFISEKNQAKEGEIPIKISSLIESNTHPEIEG